MTFFDDVNKTMNTIKKLQLLYSMRRKRRLLIQVIQGGCLLQRIHGRATYSYCRELSSMTMFISVFKDFS